MAHSYNGWPASPDKRAINVQPFGDSYGVPFPGGVKGGDVAVTLGYVARNLHHRVEPVVSGWLWGFHYRPNVNNPTVLSNHASATAIDYNAPNHPNGKRGTFTRHQVTVIREILAECQGAVFWGGDYRSVPDEMHFEINVGPSTLARIAPTLAGNAPAPTPDPEPEIREMSAAVVVQDVDTGWRYGIAPGWFAALAMPDAHGVDQYRTGVDAGLWPDDPLKLNWVQIMSMRDALGLREPAGVFVGNDAAGNPTFR